MPEFQLVVCEQLLFSNLLKIHEEETKEIILVKCDLNHPKL